MKIYRVLMSGDFDDGDSRAFWFTRKSEFKKHQRALFESCIDGGTRPDADLEEFDVPSNKDGLVEFLNKNCSR